jgi:hypothetical protein
LIVADPETLEKVSLRRPTFNVAGIVNDSPTMKRLVPIPRIRHFGRKVSGQSFVPD